MSSWHQAPLLRILLPFAVGIVVSLHVAVPLPATFLMFLVIGVGELLLVGLAPAEHRFRLRPLLGLALQMQLFLGGILLDGWRNELLQHDHFSYQTEAEQLLVYLKAPPSPKPRSVKCEVQVVGAIHGNQTHKASGSLLLYLAKDSMALKLHYGDLLWIPARYEGVAPPQNPNAFHYQKYLAFRHIHHQTYVPADSWYQLGAGYGNPLQRWAYAVQVQLVQAFRNRLQTGEEAGVAAALLFGYKGDLDPELRSAYANTGTLHVLAVSGLHVGILFLAISLILKPLERSKKGRLLRAVIIIAFLWGYAMLTGLSPSVKRAAAMFSIMTIARTNKRYTSVWNTLAGSAMVLLLFDTKTITEVGFQLSYLAVGGIVFLQPKIYHWFDFKGWLPDQIWKLTSVSLAAQLTTFPLGLLYFHQFPNYFLLSNLVVIPIILSSVYTGLGLCLLIPVPVINNLLADLLSTILKVVNQIVQTMEQLPWSTVNGISITTLETFMIYGLLIAGIGYLWKLKAPWLIGALSMTLMLLTVQLHEQWQHHHQQQLVIYHTPKYTSMGLIDGNEGILVADQALLEQPAQVQFHIRQHLWAHDISHPQLQATETLAESSTFDHPHFFSWCGKRIAVVGPAFAGRTFGQKLRTDVLVLTKSPNIEVSELLASFQFQQLVVDASNKPYLVKQWRKQAAALNVPVHVVTEQGAFVMDL